jgi:hypothetical protein
MAIEAVRFPLPVGVNITLMVQLPPAGTELPQLLLCPKSLAFVPVIAMPEMLSEALPVLERITLCAGLVEPVPTWGNVRLVAERLTLGSDAGGVLLPRPLLPPPQPARKIKPMTMSSRRHSVALEPFLHVITRPPGRRCCELK